MNKHLILIILLMASTVHAGDYALDFTTGDDHVEVPYDATLNLPDGLTMECWIYFDLLSVGQAVWGKAYAATHTAPYFEYTMFVLGTGLQMRMNTSTWNPSHVFSTGQWYHVVWTADGTKWRYYIDGSATDSTANANLPQNTNSQPLIFGQNASSGEEFDGKIDEAKIYNEALTAAEITAHYNSGSGTCSYETDQLKGAWHFSEGSGTTTADNSGNGNTGNLLPESGEPSWVTGIGLDCDAAAPSGQVIIIR